MNTYRFRCLLAAMAVSMSQGTKAQSDTISYVVAPAHKMQVCEGWGASICWWGNMCGRWSESTIDKMIDWLVSPNGLNMNIFRYNIGGGDDPNNANCTPHHMGNGKGLRAEMEGFQDYAGGPYIWERDSAQRRIMLKIKEKRPDAIFEAFSNSAPWWMTYSGCVGGNVNANDDNLKPEYYEAFAHYLVDVCKHYKDVFGIEFKTLEPFNEPNTNYWPANGSQEGCHFSAEAQADFLKVLHPILKESGLNTVISASDETSVATAVNTFKTLEKAGVKDLIGQWNTHTYINNIRARSQFGVLGRCTGKPVWQSEVGSGGNGIDGNLKLSQTMFLDIHYIVPSAWIDWQYHEEYGDQWCLVNCPYSQEYNLQRLKSYYVRQNVTMFFKQGYHFVPTTCEQALAAVNPAQDTLVMSIINNTKLIQKHRIRMPFTAPGASVKVYQTTPNANCSRILGLAKVQTDSSIVVSVPATSIITLTATINVTDEDTKIKPGDTYMILPQSNIGMAIDIVDNKVVISEQDITSPSQRWTVCESGKGDGKLMLRNEDGKILSYNHRTKAYYIFGFANESSVYTQAFDIVPVDDYFYRIGTGTLAFDLQSNGLNSGTRIGMYEYGDSPDADTRNWRFVKVASSQDNADGIGKVQVKGGVAEQQKFYNLSGIQQDSCCKGINIVKDKNGTRKLVVK